MTYTLAILEPMLIAVVPDGSNIEAAIRDEEGRAGIEVDRSKLRIISGCTLTDEVEDGDEVVYRGTTYGYLTDAEGRRYYAAVKRGDHVQV
jgi:hypothetical protein